MSAQGSSEGGIGPWLDLLVSARHLHGAGGNRRRLFNRFDEIFSAPVDWSLLAWTPRAAGTPRPFRFKKVLLRNWKAFDHADFDLATGVDRPVALIGGNNGNGKTSILEALALGIYGIRAYLDRSRLGAEGGAPGPRRSDYNQTIERAMHRQAFERGDRDMSVTIELDGDDGPFEIERHWYFGDDGSFVEEDEELVLRIGDDRHILSPPADVPSADFAFYEIERRVAPVSMLPFLLFDGEQIRRLAQRELGEQVRFGLESALGVASIKALLEDLSDYARDRGKEVIADGAESMLSSQIDALDAELTATRNELEGVEAELEPLRRRRDEIVRSIGSFGDGTYLERHQDLELRKKLEADLQAARHELLVAGVRLLPFLLIPGALLDEVELALDGAARSKTLTKGDDARMLRELISALERTEPPLPKDVLADLARRTREAWQRSVSASGAGSIAPLHLYLKGHDAGRVHELIEGSRASARGEIDRMTGSIAEIAAAIARMDRQEEQRDRAEKNRTELVLELEDTSQRISDLEGRRRRLDQVAGKQQAQVEPLQAELSRRRGMRRASGHGGTGADAARMAIASLQGSIAVAMPKHYDELAKALTAAYRSLAHKGVVETVAIADDGDVSLLDPSGRNLRDTDASAGENQIFAMALIAAVSGLGGRSLPLVIDTPLGRLDTAHRERVLDYFVRRDSQTILLSQPEEVYGRYYDRIFHRIGSEHHLVYRPESGGLGETVVEKGYFPRQAA
ncbi:AAA family ATPase [Devosia aurantiaca]|uniref:AAA family ATPase n=1 Tax=Devosia aurantiaca TaxID=2714858 RepID=A0A6M1SH78_9HYPH|nr:AAA family ATPase [Devosia aurantiaca]NGP16530.1 AAA family ATPase [Devosia aurantiaca]